MAIVHLKPHRSWFAIIPLHALAGVFIWKTCSWVWAPALLASVLLALHALLARVEINTQAQDGRSSPSGMLIPTQRIGLRVMVPITLGMMACAAILAGALMDAPELAIGSVVFFMALMLIGMPFWAAAISEAQETKPPESRGNYT
jgi:hypothetical protein